MGTISQSGTVWDSVTKRGRYEPFELQVARNQISNHSVLNIFGYQASVGTNLYPVWENVSAYTYPVSATTMLLYGTAGDTAVSVLISGLDANYNPISETLVITNGATGVTTVNSYLRINSLILTNNISPVGAVTLSNAGKTVTYAKIASGAGKSQMAIYTVPAGYTFYLTRVNAFSTEAAGGNNSCTYNVYQKNNVTGQAFNVLTTPFVAVYDARRVFPFPYTEKTDIQWQVSAGTGTTPVGIIIEGVLIANDTNTNF